MDEKSQLNHRSAMSSKRRRHTSEGSDVNNEDNDSEAAADEEDGGSVKSFGFSAFLQGLSKKRGTRKVK